MLYINNIKIIHSCYYFTLVNNGVNIVIKNHYCSEPFNLFCSN